MNATVKSLSELIRIPGVQIEDGDLRFEDHTLFTQEMVHQCNQEVRLLVLSVAHEMHCAGYRYCSNPKYPGGNGVCYYYTNDMLKDIEKWTDWSKVAANTPVVYFRDRLHFCEYRAGFVYIYPKGMDQWSWNGEDRDLIKAGPPNVRLATKEELTGRGL